MEEGKAKESNFSPIKEGLWERLERMNEYDMRPPFLIGVTDDLLKQCRWMRGQRGRLRPLNWNVKEGPGGEEYDEYVGLLANEITKGLGLSQENIEDKRAVGILTDFLARGVMYTCGVIGEDWRRVELRIVETRRFQGGFRRGEGFQENGVVNLYLAKDLVEGAYREIAGFLKKRENKYPGALGDLMMVVGHEIYHFRQLSQDPAYFYRTLLANLNVDNGDRDAYDFDQGEMAACAFSLRALVEMGMRLDKDPKEQLIGESINNTYTYGLHNLIYRSIRKRDANREMGLKRGEQECRIEARKKWDRVFKSLMERKGDLFGEQDLFIVDLYSGGIEL